MYISLLPRRACTRVHATWPQSPPCLAILVVRRCGCRIFKTSGSKSFDLTVCEQNRTDSPEVQPQLHAREGGCEGAWLSRSSGQWRRQSPSPPQWSPLSRAAAYKMPSPGFLASNGVNLAALRDFSECQLSNNSCTGGMGCGCGCVVECVLFAGSWHVGNEKM